VGLELLSPGGNEEARGGGNRQHGACGAGAFQPSTPVLGGQSPHFGEDWRRSGGSGRRWGGLQPPQANSIELSTPPPRPDFLLWLGLFFPDETYDPYYGSERTSPDKESARGKFMKPNRRQ